jgi:hypothetical protein
VRSWGGLGGIGDVRYVANPYGGLLAYSEDARAAAPEPAVWAMMLAGFGALGAVVRRRRMAFRGGRFEPSGA